MGWFERSWSCHDTSVGPRQLVWSWKSFLLLSTLIFSVLSALMPKTKAMKMCRGWTTEVHWQSGDSPKWFYCKRLTDEHTSYFPRTQPTIGRDDTDVGIRPRSGAGVPWRAVSREWIRFGKRRGRPLVDGGDAGAPIHNEFLCHSSGLVGCPGYGRGTNAPPATWDLEAKTNDTPEPQLLRNQSFSDTENNESPSRYHEAHTQSLLSHPSVSGFRQMLMRGRCRTSWNQLTSYANRPICWVLFEPLISSHGAKDFGKTLNFVINLCHISFVDSLDVAWLATNIWLQCIRWPHFATNWRAVVQRKQISCKSAILYFFIPCFSTLRTAPEKCV